MTFQFQVSKIYILLSFWATLEFFDFLEPDFWHILQDSESLESLFKNFSNQKVRSSNNSIY